ncbi:hypothetical protein [Rhizobium grahamii]|uniref:hypothetical protein n=1 Tax=Rhizobium grahamii TaxID=1120045 RepID=UPI0011B048AC|nr:hypothetical protein [Rhizobium grahamii]
MFSELKRRLDAGDVWVEGAKRFQSFESFPIQRPTFELTREEGPLPVAVDTDVEPYLNQQRQILNGGLAGLSRLAAAEEPDDVNRPRLASSHAAQGDVFGHCQIAKAESGRQDRDPHNRSFALGRCARGIFELFHTSAHQSGADDKLVARSLTPAAAFQIFDLARLVDPTKLSQRSFIANLKASEVK